jgi:uncharacterized protein (TIGR02145 family)
MLKFTILLLLCLFSSILQGQDATMIYKNAVGSTVTIEADEMIGSGFFIAEDLIVTNYHVVNGAEEVSCFLSNSSTKYIIDGYIALDKANDLIVLHVLGLKRKPLIVSKEQVVPGQRVFVLGSPKGLPASISDGLISGLRDFDGTKLIQITAPISPGSSGGPVLNYKGELIGISVAQLAEAQNLNFAIPVIYLHTALANKSNSIVPFSSMSSRKAGTNSSATNSYFVDDRDGRTYITGKFGTQTWIAENLKFVTTSGSWCFDDINSNCMTFGRFYNWETAMNVCPSGWHVPSAKELIDLFLPYGKISYDGEDLFYKGVFGPYEPRLTEDTYNRVISDDKLNVPDLGEGNYEDVRTLIWSSTSIGGRAFAIYLRKEDKYSNSGVHFSDYPKTWFGFCRCIKD